MIFFCGLVMFILGLVLIKTVLEDDFGLLVIFSFLCVTFGGGLMFYGLMPVLLLIS
jgi:hypothetical protein